jgi:hypothetical protein
MSKISEMTCSKKKLPKVNALFIPQIIPVKANNNDLTDFKEEDFCNSEMLITNILSASQFYDCFYFHNRILDQYPNLYREFNNKNFDYYRITNDTSYSLCKLDYNDKENIEGR